MSSVNFEFGLNIGGNTLFYCSSHFNLEWMQLPFCLLNTLSLLETYGLLFLSIKIYRFFFFCATPEILPRQELVQGLTFALNS